MKTIKSNLFDIFVLDKGEELNTEEINSSHAFVVQGLNVYRFSRNAFSTALIPAADKVSEKVIEEIYGSDKDEYTAVLLEENFLDLEFSHEDMAYVMAYFRDIYEKFKTEACIVLMAHPDMNEWYPLLIPQVQGSGVQVQYLIPNVHPDELEKSSDTRYNKIVKDEKMFKAYEKSYAEYQDLIKEGWIIYGTIHSHCNMPAFHSGTDDSDEENFEGLHITIGKVTTGWDFCARYMLPGGHSFKLTCEEIFDAPFKILTDLADETEIDSEDLDLMNPNLNTTVHSSHNFRAKKIPWISSGFFSESWKNSQNWDAKNEDPFEETDIKEKFTDNVFFEESMVRLINTESQRRILVTKVFYEDHQESFYPEWREIDFDDISDDFNLNEDYEIQQMISEMEEEEWR